MFGNGVRIGMKNPQIFSNLITEGQILVIQGFYVAGVGQEQKKAQE